jgi:hypothetical protein
MGSLLVFGCCGQYRYTYDGYDARPRTAGEARTLLATAAYVGPVEDVDLNDVLWHINDASHVAVEVRATWVPRYNHRFDLSDVAGGACLEALRLMAFVYHMNAFFQEGRIILVPERCSGGPQPSALVD